MKEVKKYSGTLLILWLLQACAGIPLPTNNYPDFSIQTAPTPLYPSIDTTSIFISAIIKKGSYIYLPDKSKQDPIGYVIEQVDTVTHTFLINRFYRRNQKRRRKFRYPKDWPYSSLIPLESLFKHRLHLEFITSDSVHCTLFHLPDTLDYPVEMVGRIKFARYTQQSPSTKTAKGLYQKIKPMP